MAFNQRSPLGLREVSIQSGHITPPLSVSSWAISNHHLGKADESGDGLESIQNIMQSLPPLFGTIHDQTGISPPAWLAQMPPESRVKGPGPRMGGYEQPGSRLEN